MVGIITLAVVAFAGAPAAPSGGQEATARVDSEGWWNTAPAEAPVPLPPVGVAPAPQLPAPDVPEDAIAVEMRAGRPGRVAALGIVLDAEPGSTVDAFVLRLKEAEGSFAQRGSEPAVLACPVTSFLVPEKNGSPANVPEADCETAKAEGVRADDGTWTFDLTAIAAAWLDPFGTLEPNGIRLDPIGDPPATFQVAFTGVEGAALTADLSPPPDAAGDPFASGSGSFTPPASSADVGRGSGFSPAPIDTAPLDVAPIDAGPVEPAAPAVDAPVEPTGEPSTDGGTRVAAPVAASRAGETFGNWPAWMIPLVLVGLLLALAASLVLGPAGRRRPELARRQGGVSRALASTHRRA